MGREPTLGRDAAGRWCLFVGVDGSDALDTGAGEVRARLPPDVPPGASRPEADAAARRLMERCAGCGGEESHDRRG